MASRFDGGAVLAGIATNPSAFPALKTEIDTTARKLLMKQLRAASLDLAVFSRLFAAVGEAGVRAGLDEMTLKDMSSIARRLDPANADLTTMNETEIGHHLCALARGDAKPVAGKKIAATPRARKPTKDLSKIGEVLNSKVHSGKMIKPTTPTKASRTKSHKASD